MITQERLKELLHYNPDTGIFTRKISSGGQKAGKVAGWVTGYGYRVIRVNDKLEQAHRLAFLYVNGKIPSEHTDHINHNRDDNKWGNLREVTQAENNKNYKLFKSNKTGLHGVHKSPKCDWWWAMIGAKQVYLGGSKDFFEVCCMRKSAEVRYGFHENNGRVV